MKLRYPGLIAVVAASAFSSMALADINIGPTIDNRTSVENSNRNMNANTNRNSNTNANTNRNSNSNRNVNNIDTDARSSSRSNSNNGGVSVENHDTNKVIVPPGLSALHGTSCMGSTTGSLGVAPFAIGIGSTWHDEECALRENIKIAAQFDANLAAEMLNDLSGVQAARRRMQSSVQITSSSPPAQTVGAQASFVPPYWCAGRDMTTASRSDKKACLG